MSRAQVTWRTRSPPNWSPPAIGATLDTRTDLSFGRRVTDWELKGVPVRIEIGPRDLAGGEVTLVRRDTGEKSQVPVAEVVSRVGPLLGHDPGGHARRRDRVPRSPHGRCVHDDEAREAAQTGFARLAWSDLGTDGERSVERARDHRPMPATAGRNGAGRPRTSLTSSPPSPAPTDAGQARRTTCDRRPATSGR